MKMNPAQIEQTLTQFEAEPIPVDHPMMVQLTRMFGEHTYFLDDAGLNIVEPVEVEEGESDGPLGMVVNVATWIDPSAASLQPHAPEPTERRVSLEPRNAH
ncbi:MAG: hypothetical protein JOY64_01300 [Alphaproteobacteria bacterium]|nr:hypothetical protein [Alphaproteobacteria bacterium]MBV8406238.1 hypothetical protein [Alphaproteobacteria bacterium]